MPKQAAKRSKQAPSAATPEPMQAMQRREMIAQRAYLYAEARGFQGGEPERDWLKAEAEIDRELKTNA
jgi:hypothetical protein